MMTLWKYLGMVTYWLTFPLIWIYVRISPPRSRVLVVRNGSILLVGSWLGSGKMTIPGGGINKGEAPIDAAVRELHEELGLLVTTSQLRPLGLREVTGRLNLLSRHYLFVVELESMPVIQPARLEVIHYNWTRIDELGNVNYLTTPVIDAVATWSKP